jgi:two-component system, LytTR family, sensor kinase
MFSLRWCFSLTYSMFNHRFRYYFIALLSVFTYIATVLCDLYYYFEIDIQWYYAFGTIAAITLTAWETGRLLQSVFKKHYQKYSSKVTGLLYFYLASGTIVTIATVALVLSLSMLLLDFSFSKCIIPLKLNLIYAHLVNLLFHLIHAIFFYFREYETQLLAAEENKRLAAQNELALIKNQINPHFLFNNLNVLSALIMQNSTEANKFIEAFSQVYRYILVNQNKEMVMLQDELNFIEPYIFLLEKRFASGLKISVDIADKYLSYSVLPASLQMLIENAIKHNIATKNKPLHIQLKSNGHDTVIVRNNLQLRETVESSTQIGLQNIAKRYEFITGRQMNIEQTSEDFIVTLPIVNVQAYGSNNN